jgi:hypothetical protein
LGRIGAGAIVAPGEQERLTEEASAVAHLLDLLDSSANRPTPQRVAEEEEIRQAEQDLTRQREASEEEIQQAERDTENK